MLDKMRSEKKSACVSFYHSKINSVNMDIMGCTCSCTDYLFSWLPGHVMYGTVAAIGSIAFMNLSPFLPLSYNERNTVI